MNREELIRDLSPFADIGSNEVRVSDQKTNWNASLTRDARPLKLKIDKSNGRIEARWGGAEPRSFSNFPAMLSSEIFANLRRWADAQRELLKAVIPSGNKLLPIHGLTHARVDIHSIDEADGLIGAESRADETTEVLLIDGPAGIGKTSLIEQLSYRRAAGFKGSPRPLILHVKSRGRVLSNLQDLMAFSLQTIRSQITYDQIPVLCKYGLVIIAIDGFDELSNPNGYEMAWAQLGELVENVRGRGTLILAGRDTFISRSRILEDVEALRDGVDSVIGLTLSSPSAEQARIWLEMHDGWNSTSFSIPSIEVLLEDGSFALRPVFLKVLAEHVKPNELRDKHERYLTPFLVNRMIAREGSLFGKPVEALMDEPSREKFLLELLREVARQMADSQTESIEATEIGWIADAILGDEVPADLVSLIRHRASVVAFFMNDDRPGYKCFLHSYLLNYFVALVAIEAIAINDIPKFIRRNILGSEFLSVFSDVCAEASVSSKETFSRFWEHASTLSMSYTSSDRGLRNVGALVLAALPSAKSKKDIILREFSVDEAVVRGPVPECSWDNLEIIQLDCRGADLSAVKCRNVSVRSLIADSSVRVSPSFPTPKKVSLPGGKEIVGQSAVDGWLNMQGRDPVTAVTSGYVTADLRAHPMYKLLKRAARIRQYWMRSDSEEDMQAHKVVGDSNWIALSELLKKHGYLREETRQASGRASTFYHVKHRESILVEAENDESLKSLYADILSS